ncbi:hypothetical protein Taro_044415 [Colocasia esculenta]|uniref:Uncharacterized protein n=1 Tax=Colocasia esculenta TaxID=4460 RepID=A0A843WTZ5_COLES|nr:hypothetical protein [Colocasia esculenta]
MSRPPSASRHQRRRRSGRARPYYGTGGRHDKSRVATRFPVATRFLSRPGACRGCLAHRVAITTAQEGATASGLPRVFPWPRLACRRGPQGRCALRTFWWERGRLPPCVERLKAVPCVSALADGPSGGFRKGCRARLCLLGLSWLQASCAGFCGGCPASSLFARPARLLEGVLRAAGVLKSRTWSRRGKRWGQRRSVVCRALLAGSGSPRWLRRSSGADQLVLLTASLCVGSGATEVVGRSQQLASKRGGLCVPLLAACGGGLVALVVTVFLTLFPRMCSLASALRVLSGCLVQTPDCCFCSLFLGVVRGGTDECSFLDLVEYPRSRVVLLVGPRPCRVPAALAGDDLEGACPQVARGDEHEVASCSSFLLKISSHHSLQARPQEP